MKRLVLMILFLGLFISTQTAQADWTPAKRLTWTSGYSGDPTIAIDSSNSIHVVWHDNTPGYPEIYYRGSKDGGTTWSAVKRLTWTSGYSVEPVVAIDSSDAVHVVWYDDTPGNEEIYYRRSGDGGATWSTPKRLTWSYGDSYDPAIAIDSTNTIYVVWFDYTPGNREICYKKSTDGGTTWSAVERLTWTSGSSFCPDVAIDSDDHIHVVWYDDTPGNIEVYHKRSTDGGTTWSAAQRLTWTSDESFAPAIAIDYNNHIHVAWQDWTPGNGEEYYRRSTDGGASWSTAKRLTWTADNSYAPAISIDSNNHIHVIWHDWTPDDADVYYRKSMDGGTTWSAVKRLTWTSGDSGFPALAIDSADTLHLVWKDDTPGNCEIYYKRGK